MAGHPDIVREYIELRNALAETNPQSDLRFEVFFCVSNNALMAMNSASKAKLELAKMQPNFFQLYIPYYGYQFEVYSNNLIKYINNRLKKTNRDESIKEIIKLAYAHRKSLDLKTGSRSSAENVGSVG